ncbi:MAG TPA: hypothetical protein EYH36_04030, partial [Desulfocapsa sulfexigens]|nr:hypothetical protein [Desulfocapsa sulfexigens]
MHTLKFQLGLTLSILLFTSMFLFGFVMLMLWQRNGIQQETEISEKLLHIAAASLSTDPPGFSKKMTSWFQESGILCLQWQDTVSSPLQSHGSCPADLNLVSLLQDAATHGKTKTSYTGVSWNGFFLSKQYLLMATPLQTGTKNRG